MTWFIGVSAGCTTVMVPGWAAIAVALILAAPRLAARVLHGPRGSEGA